MMERLKNDIGTSISNLHLYLHDAAALKASSVLEENKNHIIPPGVKMSNNYERIKEIARKEAALHRKIQRLQGEINKFIESE